MASLVRSWARRAARFARDVADVSPVSTTNEIVTSFPTAADVARGWRAWSDEPHGGTSTATLTWTPITDPAAAASDGDDDVGAMVLEGVLSTKTVAPLVGEEDPAALPFGPGLLPREDEEAAADDDDLRPASAASSATPPPAATPSTPSTSTTSAPPRHVTRSLKRSGFAGCSTADLPPGEFLDLDAFTALRFRVRADGRPYVVSIKTDNWVTGKKEGDLWQAFLFAPAGRWADVIVPMRRFLKTYRGRVMEHEYEMSASRVTGLGLAVANHSDTAGGAGGGSSGSGDKSPSAPVGVSGGEGPFRLEIASIVGLRLDDEALEMAKRREEARWGRGPGAAPEISLGLAARALARDVARSDARDRRAARTLEETKPKKKKPEFEGEMLPSFLGASEEESSDERNRATTR